MVSLVLVTAARLEKNLVTTAVCAGIALSIMYPARTFLPLPNRLATAFFIFFGPLLVVAFVGLFPFLTKPVPSVAAIIATVFGVIAGIANTMFSVVQLTNLHYIRAYMKAASTPEAKQVWQDILKGVFTVCKKVRNDSNYWQQVETYIGEHSELQFTHGICPTCYDAVVRPQIELMKCSNRCGRPT
jgi:hypothetical protein